MYIWAVYTAGSLNGDCQPVSTSIACMYSVVHVMMSCNLWPCKPIGSIVGVKLKFPVGFLSTEPNQYTILTKKSYKTDKQL